MHQVLKHILEEGSESDNESSEDEEEEAECFIHSDLPNAGPGTEPQALVRRAPSLSDVQVLVCLAI